MSDGTSRGFETAQADEDLRRKVKALCESIANHPDRSIICQVSQATLDIINDAFTSYAEQTNCSNKIPELELKLKNCITAGYATNLNWNDSEEPEHDEEP